MPSAFSVTSFPNHPNTTGQNDGTGVAFLKNAGKFPGRKRRFGYRLTTQKSMKQTSNKRPGR